MAELISMTYEQARAEHFETLKDKAGYKMNYWAAKDKFCNPNNLKDPTYGKASEYAAEYNYYKDALEALENQLKWISVEERLPEDDLPENSDVKIIKVFVAIKGKNGTTVRTQTRHRRTLFDTRGEPFFDWEWRYSSGNVTHWMPLPEPPKEDI